MEIVDLQMHEPGAFLPWAEASEEARRDVLKESLWHMMEAVGVNAVVLHPVEDMQFAEDLATVAPGRFASVPVLIARDSAVGVTIDASGPRVSEEIAEFRRRPGVVAVRFVGSPGRFEKFKEGGYHLAFKACEDQGIPVVLLVTGVLEMAGAIAERYPGLQLIVDHFGLPQRPLRDPEDPQWTSLPQLLALSRRRNIAVKMCGAPAMSEDGYPFADVWPWVAEVIERFGVNRVAWGSDISRFRGRMGWRGRPAAAQGEYVGKHTYMESLGFFLYNEQLSTGEKEAILGGTARQLLGWPVASAEEGR